MKRDPLGRLPERGAAVDVLFLVRRHRSGASFREESSLVAFLGKVRKEAVVVLLIVDLLWNGRQDTSTVRQRMRPPRAVEGERQACNTPGDR